MFEYLMLQKFLTQQMLTDVFAPLVRLLPPFWLSQLEEEAQHDRLECCLLPRNPEWLRFELPQHIVRGRRIARAILRDPDDADDAVVNALFRTECVPHIPNNVGVYFDRAVRTSAYDIQRRRLRSATLSLEEVLLTYDLYDDSLSPEDELIAAEYTSLVHEAMAQLPVNERHAIELHYFEELTIRDTAAALGVSVSTAQNVLYRARRNLGRILAPKVLPPRRNGNLFIAISR